MAKRDFNDSNEIAAALQAASKLHKTRVTIALTTIALLTLGVFAAPGKFGGSFDLSSLKRLLTTRSIVEVAEYDDMNAQTPSSDDAKSVKYEKTLVAEDEDALEFEEDDEVARDPIETRGAAETNSNAAGENALLAAVSPVPLNLESDQDSQENAAQDAIANVPTLDAESELTVQNAQNAFEPALDRSSDVLSDQAAKQAFGRSSEQPSVPTAPVNYQRGADSEKDADFPAFDFLSDPSFSLKDAKKKKLSANRRVFARAANIVATKSAPAKYFAYAANIVGTNSVLTFDSFSGAAKDAFLTKNGAETSIAARVKPNARVENSPNADNIASVAYTNENASSKAADRGVSFAGYQTPQSQPNSSAPNVPRERPNAVPRRAEDLTRANAAQNAAQPAAQPAANAPSASAAQTGALDETAQCESERQKLRAKGLLGPRVERWTEREFRATGIVRSKETGKADFFEALGATPEDAAKNLEAVVQAAQ